ncbi:sensor histidine kinase [Sulfurospirillum barnesii]|uniref:histidine kinase n=1 Tax=Sulfurospirillum barnesii (strain ATCC 700032 / DSM 10660 / SES-3) TaxID=760154 RepID=I3XZT8_SULBS|nr:ABC transporter substrate binding protein [Sulfurospirillum barnesii]AFL69462.1 histidine kinase [Sulfurospirillum barnesii SES-3]
MKKILLFLILFVLMGTTHAWAHDKKILIINSYHKGFQWSDDVLHGMEEVFYKHPEITMNILYMDSKRINSKEYYEKLRELYKLQLKNQKHDLIVAVDKFAYDFLIEYYHELFTDEPILFTGLEQFDLKEIHEKGLEDRIYGVMERRAIGETIPLMAKMMPKLKKITIINDASANGDDSEPFIREAMEEYKESLEIEYIRQSTLEELEKRFSTPNKEEAIFYIRFYNDRYGNLYKNNQIAAMIQKSALPVFITDTLFIGKGAFGGKLVPVQKLGMATGEMVLDALDKKIHPLHVETFEEYWYQFDVQKIKQFEIYPNPVIPEFELVNEPETFFDRHRKLIDAVFLISPFLIFLILGLFHNIYMRIRSEKELRAVEVQKNKHQQFIIQQSKLAEIGEVFSSIAHQWKNPLVEIATIAQDHFYSTTEQTEEQNNQFVHDIMVQVHYMTDTINSFQAFIMPSTTKTVFDVNEAIETMLKIINHTIKYNYIDVSVDISNATNLMVKGYKNEFMQTLLNIVNNAKDQIIQQREEKKIKRGTISIMVYNHAQKVIIEICDNAGGIQNEKLSHLFDAYFTTKKQGHGIGLYMSKLIIEDKMGGKITASNKNDGACFTITLGNVT